MGATTDQDPSHVIQVDGATANCGELIRHTRCTKRIQDWFNSLRKCLQETGSKSIGKYVMASKEKTPEGEAYKKLMEDLAGEPTDRPISIIMWIIHVILLVLFVILVTTFASVHVIHKELLFHMRIHGWVALLMVVVSGYPFVSAVTFFISESLIWIWKMNKYVFFFTKELKNSVDVMLWFALVLWVWFTWFRSRVIKDVLVDIALSVHEYEYNEELLFVVQQITRFLMALTIGALIWIVKSAVFLKLLADLHFTELCKRIRQTILDFHGIQYIENPNWRFLTHSKNEEGTIDKPKSLAPMNITGNENSGNGGGGNVVDKTKGDDVLTFWMCVSQLQRKTAPIWILKRLTYTYMEHMKKKPTVLRDLENVDDDEKLMEEAKNMLNKVTEGKNSDEDITREDLGKFNLGANEINLVFKLFASKDDGNKMDVITQDQFLRWAVLAVKNCLGLERTIESSMRIFWKLDVLMSACVIVITLVIWLLLSELVNTGQMAILFAPFLSASFIFGESLKRSFDGIIFVFGMHPFDVGDRVIIENVEMKVSEMNIMTTTFIIYNTGVEAIYPNSELSMKMIINLDITPDQPDTIEFTMPFDTPQELICDLQLKIKKILDDDITYTSNTAVAKKMISDTEVTLIVYFKHLVSYLSAETKAQHRSRIFCKIIRLKKQIIEAIQMHKERKEREDSSQIVSAILRFKIDVKVKLFKIEELKNKILGILHSHDPRLKDGSEILFTGINKQKIIMDVKIYYPKELFTTPNQRDKLKAQIQQAIDVESKFSKSVSAPASISTPAPAPAPAPGPNPVKEKRVVVEWLKSSDWDDHC